MSLSLTRRHVSAQRLTRSNGSSLLRALSGEVARVRLLLACGWQVRLTLTSTRGTSCLSNIPWIRALLCTSPLCPAPLNPALPPPASSLVAPFSLSPLGLAVQPPTYASLLPTSPTLSVLAHRILHTFHIRRALHALLGSLVRLTLLRSVHTRVRRGPGRRVKPGGDQRR